jgi:hypothetical protein
MFDFALNKEHNRIMNYSIFTKKPITRAGVIRKLMSMGYPLPRNLTPSDFQQSWPARLYPYVTVELYGGKTIINLRAILPADYYPVPVNKVYMIIPAFKEEPKPLNIPRAAKYSIQYQKADGTTGDYMISNPIEADEEKITCYAFKHGVRTFKRNQIRRFTRVA